MRVCSVCNAGKLSSIGAEELMVKKITWSPPVDFIDSTQDSLHTSTKVNNQVVPRPLRCVGQLDEIVSCVSDFFVYTGQGYYHHVF